MSDASLYSIRSKLLWPWLVLVIGLILTLFGWRWSSQVVFDTASLRFNNEAEDARLGIQARLNSYGQVLRGSAALFAASRDVSRQEWHEYVTSLQLPQFIPGMGGLGYAPYLREGQKNWFVETLRTEGFPDFNIWPQGRRRAYAPVQYIEPFAGANLRAFGFDMYSEPTRRSAMDRARNSGEISMTGQVRLAQHVNPGKAAGFLLYMPVYDYHLPLSTQAERQAALRGFVFTPFRIQDLIQDTLDDRFKGMNLRIYAGSQANPAMLFFTSGIRSQSTVPTHIPIFSRTASIDFGGQTWTLQFSSQPAFYLTMDRVTPLLVLFGGLLLSALLFGVIWSLSRTRERAQALAMRMTEQLRQSEARFRAAFDQAAVGMTLSTPEGQLLQVNQCFCDMLGYTPEELFNRNIIDLSPAPDHDLLARHRDQALAGLVDSYIQEMQYLCHDGALRWGRLAGSLVRHADGSPHYFVDIIEDITQAKQAAQSLQQSYEHLQQMHRELESFSYSVSHDLRTPLRAIEGFSLILQEDYRHRLDDEGISHLQRIRMASQRMAGLIDALLSMTRISRKDLISQEVDLSEKGRSVAQLLSASQPDRQADWIIWPGMRVSGDPILLETVVANLLENAWKFTSRCSRARIEFGMGEQSGEMVFFVRDNGVGFDMAYVDKLFGAFQRLHKEQDFKGYGIGLANTQRIIQRHGGRIWAEAALDQGATFYFTLPPTSLLDRSQQRRAASF